MTTLAANRIDDLVSTATARGMNIGEDDMATLRRASMALSRWGELECGDGNDYASWSIERDETTGKPYMVTHPHTGKATRRAIADREAGALKRIAAVCSRLGLHYYHQTDPRGAALYVASEPMTDNNYSTTGLAIYK